VIKAILFFLIFVPVAGFAVEAELVFPQNEIKQGTIADAVLQVTPENMSSIQVSKLRGASFAKTIYFYQVSPWIHENGSGSFNSHARIIFLDIPQGQALKDSVAGVEVELKLGKVNVIPTEPLDQLKFADFTIPSPIKILKWALGGLLIVALIFAGWFGYRKYSLKKSEKLRKLKLKEEISSAQDYAGVVEIWKQKHKYLKTFPQLEKPFRELELVLFKYQFKPSQLPSEKDEIVQAYKRFVTESQEGLRGV
jgi:hypothetical protein